MSVITAARAEIKGYGENAGLITWTPLVLNDTGEPVEMPGSAIRSIQFVGTFGSGGTIVWEGSNDGTNYVTLTDPQGNAISKTSASIEACEEVTRYVRPRVSAGDGTTSLSAYLVAVRRGR